MSRFLLRPVPNVAPPDPPPPPPDTRTASPDASDTLKHARPCIPNTPPPEDASLLLPLPVDAALHPNCLYEWKNPMTAMTHLLLIPIHLLLLKLKKRFKTLWCLGKNRVMMLMQPVMNGADLLHLKEPVKEASEKEKDLESRMEQASSLIKEKGSRILELESLSRTRAWRSAIQSTNNLLLQPDLDQITSAAVCN